MLHDKVVQECLQLIMQHACLSLVSESLHQYHVSDFYLEFFAATFSPINRRAAYTDIPSIIESGLAR